MLIVVPCDFTPVVDAAFKYVESLAKFHSDIVVHLLHIAEKSKSEAKREELQRIAERYSKDAAITVKPVVGEGDIADEIPGYAEEVHADLVIMGIHETRGFAKLFASRAIRVVLDANIPFLTVQKPPKSENAFKRFLMPLGAQAVEMGKFEWAVRNAKLYNSEIFVLTEPYNDQQLIARRDGNIMTMRKVFDANGIKYTIKPSERTDFKNHFIEFAKENDIDILLIMVTQGLKPMMNSSDQQIISNPLGLPVLCINPMMIS